MVHDHYVLKHSRLSIVFQLIFLMLILILLSQLISIYFLIPATLALIAIWIMFRRHKRVEYLQQLEQDLWSIQYANDPKVYRVKIRQILNHGLYVVLYFEQSKHQSLVIWRDQVALLAWKRLLMRAKLQ